MLPMLFYQLGFLSSHFFAIFLLLLLFFWYIDVFPLSFLFFPHSVFIWSLYIPTPKISLDCLEFQQPGLLILNSKQSSCLILCSAEGLQAYSSTPTLCHAGA